MRSSININSFKEEIKEEIGGSSGVNIVEEETQIGTFLGKPLYRKAYQINSVSKGNTSIDKTINVNIVDTLVDVYGGFIINNNKLSLTNNSDYGVYVYIADNSSYCLNIFNVNTATLSNVKIVIEYTKK